MTALEKEKLTQETDQLKNQNYWAWTAIGSIGGGIGTILLAIVGFLTVRFSIKQWYGNRQVEEERQRRDRNLDREKRAEERFQKVVEGLGGDKPEAQVGAAIMLRTFLQPGYEKFYQQTFDLAVTHLRLRSVDPNTPAPLDLSDYVPLDSLSQALITVFKESFPLARNELEKSQFDIEIRSLDASHIRLDDAYLRGADLKYVQMREAFLIKAELRKADLSHAYLTKAKLSHANLRKAILSGARLRDADLNHAHLDEAHLDGTYLREAHFDGAHLDGADLRGADFDGRAHLDGADLRGADLRGVKGLTKEQLAACQAKGAIIDENPTISVSQSTVIPPLPAQSNDTQASSVPSAQGSTPPPDPDGNPASSQQEPEL